MTKQQLLDEIIELESELSFIRKIVPQDYDEYNATRLKHDISLMKLQSLQSSLEAMRLKDHVQNTEIVETT